MTQATLARPTGPASIVGLSVFATMGVWCTVVLGASLSGAFVSPGAGPPWAILAAVVLPILAFGLVYRWWPAFAQFVLEIDMRPLILAHSWRFAGVSFLFLWAHGVLPLVFAIPAGVGDAIAAAAAVAIGIALYSRAGASRRLVAAWNTFGLVDFIVAVGIGALAGSGALLHRADGVSTAAMESFPLSLIPGFLVPLFAITHLIVYLQLKRRWPGTHAIRFDL